MGKILLPPVRPADPINEPDVSPSNTGDNFYPESNIPVDPDYARRLEKGYKTPMKKMPPVKKSTGGMVRGTGCAERGKGKGTVY